MKKLSPTCLYLKERFFTYRFIKMYLTHSAVFEQRAVIGLAG
jgi:hypothetical protein